MVTPDYSITLGLTVLSFTLFLMINHNLCLKWSYSLSSKSVGLKALQRISWVILLSLPSLLALFCLSPLPSQHAHPISHTPWHPSYTTPKPRVIQGKEHPVLTQRVLKWNSCLALTIWPWAKHFSLGLSFLTYKIWVIAQVSQGGCLDWKRLTEITRIVLITVVAPNNLAPFPFFFFFLFAWGLIKTLV